ncbi:MAG: vitamin K epoxide reductase family protein [Polyangiaceae bacterium]
MRSVWLVLVLRLALVAAILASASLVVDYQNPGDPTFCGPGSGCAVVRNAPVTAQITERLNIPLPQLGLVAYVALFVASLVARSLAYRITVAALAGIGALAAMALLYLQRVEIGAWCPWCVVVDVSAIVAGVCAVLLVTWARRDLELGRPTADEARVQALSGMNPALPAWSLAGVAAVVLPFVWGANPVVAPPHPDLAARFTPGKVLLVQFTDFQCPFCRKLHPVIEELRKEHGDRLVYDRRMKPLSMHPGAMPAAIAYLCAPEDKREAMAGALYEAEDTELTARGVALLAGRLGFDAAAFAECVESDRTRQRLREDAELYDRLGPRGLPLTFVNARTIVGFDEPKIRRAVAVEAGGGGIGLPTWSLFVVVGAMCAIASALTLRSARRGAKSSA